jgi:hypothetical protein
LHFPLILSSQFAVTDREVNSSTKMRLAFALTSTLVVLILNNADAGEGGLLRKLSGLFADGMKAFDVLTVNDEVPVCALPLRG